MGACTREDSLGIRHVEGNMAERVARGVVALEVQVAELPHVTLTQGGLDARDPLLISLGPHDLAKDHREQHSGDDEKRSIVV